MSYSRLSSTNRAFSVTFCVAVLIFMLSLLIFCLTKEEALPDESIQDEQTQGIVFDCKKDIKNQQRSKAFIDCLKTDKKNLMVIMDDKKIDEKEAILLQRVLKKINAEYDEKKVVNVLNTNDRDFIKQLERFDDKGYTEIINARYKTAVDLFFSEWIESEQEYVDFS